MNADPDGDPVPRCNRNIRVRPSRRHGPQLPPSRFACTVPGRLMRAIHVVAALLAIPFATVQPAHAASTVLRWTATGDDSLVGQATAYDLRYSTSPITLANFGSSTGVPNLPPPAPAGTHESFTVNGLQTGVMYYFAIKARDEAGTLSLISIVIAKPATGTVDVPPQLGLGFSVPRPNPARVGTLFALTLPSPTRVQIEAFDLEGRRVRVLANDEYPAGEKSVVWDLFDEQGTRVSPGFYRVRARVGTATFLRTVMVVR